MKIFLLIFLSFIFSDCMPCSSRISQTWNDILGKILGNKKKEMKLNFNVVFCLFYSSASCPSRSRRWSQRGDFQGYLSRWVHFELIFDLCCSIAKCFVAWVNSIVDWLALPDLVQKRKSIKKLRQIMRRKSNDAIFLLQKVKIRIHTKICYRHRSNLITKLGFYFYPIFSPRHFLTFLSLLSYRSTLWRYKMRNPTELILDIFKYFDNSIMTWNSKKKKSTKSSD